MYYIYPQEFSDEWKVVEDFGFKYAKRRHTKYRDNNPANIETFNRQQENNAIVKQWVDEILLEEDNKVSAEEEAQENIESDFNENDLYHIDNMSLDDKKENIEWCKSAFECKLENKYGIEIQNGMTCIHKNKGNKWAEWNLLYDIINPHKHAQSLNSHYSPI